MLKGKNYSWWGDNLFLIAVLGGLFFIMLGVRSLFSPDEGRYAEIAREMVVSGDYVTPYLNGIKYFEKPVLFYWLGAAAIKVGGLHVWSLRCVNGLLGLLGCLFTYGAGRKLYGRVTGLLAALILGTSLLYFVMVHMISLDLPVTVFLMVSLYAFLLGTQQAPGTNRRLYLWSTAIAAALAVLTKGLIGIVFPALIVAVWLTIIGEWRLIKRLYLPSSIFIFLFIVAPWHILVGLRNPEFFYFYFIEQHFLRYATMDVGHYQPAWFFIPCLLLGFFPWIVFLPQAIANAIPTAWRQRRDYQTELFFILWAALIFIFFSFSKSKLIPYILPIFPPLAMLTARYLCNIKKTVGIKLGYLCLVILAAVIAYTLNSFAHDVGLPDPRSAIFYLDSAALILMIGSLAGCVYAFRKPCIAVVITVVTSWFFLLLIVTAIPSIDTRTIQPLTTVLKPILQPQDDVITYNQYFQELPFYLQRRVAILNWRNEMSYGMQHQDTHEWMIDDYTFWLRWHSHQRVFVIISAEEFKSLKKLHPEEKFFVVGKTMNNVLVSNRVR